jgi:hypothetical protein
VQSKYLITFASLITAVLINSAWCQQDQKMRPPADRQAAPTQNDPSEPCAGLDGREWRECMRANVPCFAMHGRAYEMCCETEKDSPAC